MPAYYLLRDNDLYSDAANYPGKPANRPEGTWVEGIPDGLESHIKKNLNQKLETEFKIILPQHLGQPYLTPAVISHVMMAKVAVIDANNFDPTGYLARATIEGLTLPAEMENARQALLNIFPAA